MMSPLPDDTNQPRPGDGAAPSETVGGTPDQDRSTLTGHLLFLVHARGSKSESWMPHLVVDPSHIHRLHREGDNPFLESSLASFHGCFVEVRGHWEPSGRFLIVEDCAVCPPPFPPKGEPCP
jgi:hypothetical protein